MKIVVGLGNPGDDYAGTRHNVGWLVVDHLADRWSAERWRRDGDSMVAPARVGPLHVRLLKPQTYMNLSGDALRPYLRRPAWSPATDLLIVVDDVALPLGLLRLRADGSAGGHNGLKSIEHAVGGRGYARMRIGIQPSSEHGTGVLRDYVLGPFGKAERAELTRLMPRYEDAVTTWVRDGIGHAMNVFNRKEAATDPE